jgi:hypothetical protein
MNPKPPVPLGLDGSEKEIPATAKTAEHLMANCPARPRRPFGRALGNFILLAAIGLAAMLPLVVSGNVAEEMFKTEEQTNGVAVSESDTNGVAKRATISHISPLDPKGDSWVSMQRSIEQFAHPEFLLRLFLSFTLAVACAWLVAWHPRRSSRMDSLSDLEERKTLILLGMVGAIVAELSGNNQTLAFVIFGIGALLRFRTVLDNPKLTGKAITVVVIGLACGVGAWTMAVFVTAFSWVLIYWLDSHIACRIEIRLAEEMDPKLVFGSLQSLLVARRCRLQSSAVYKKKRQLEFLLHIPADLDLKQLELDVRAKLPKADDARIKINVM